MRSNKWRRLSDIPVPLRSGAMVAKGKKLYIMGGWSQKPSDKVFVYVKVMFRLYGRVTRKRIGRLKNG